MDGVCKGNSCDHGEEGRQTAKIPDAACLATKVFFGTKSMERQRE